jgi:hypothetical protein
MELRWPARILQPMFEKRASNDAEFRIRLRIHLVAVADYAKLAVLRSPAHASR